MKNIVYLLNKTHECQGYNEHSIYLNIEDAKKEFFKEKNNAYAKEVMEDIVGENYCSYYFKTEEGFSRIYIEPIEIGKPLNHWHGSIAEEFEFSITD